MHRYWKLYTSLVGGSWYGRWRWISLTVALFALAYVYYSVLPSGGYRWLCVECQHDVEVALNVAAAEVSTPPAISATAASLPPPPTNLSHIIFGIGASAETWNQRRGFSELWWRQGATRGHVWLEEVPHAGTWAATSPPFHVIPKESQFGERASAARMARIVVEEYRLAAAAVAGEKVRWFVMGDDDTVFFVENLVTVLGKYDHEEMYYVGAGSESVEQNAEHSYEMAFGGGGFAVSAPAAAELSREMGGCLERYNRLYGSDERVQSCLSELGIPLTRETGFHQLDIRGDAYGMLAAHPVAPLLSLHHLDYLQPIRPNISRLGGLRSLVYVSHFDPARILQQCFCYETRASSTWSVSVSWGYTVQIYPWVVEPRELEVPLRTFTTWKSNGDGPFMFNTRPFHGDHRPCEQQLLYFLDWIDQMHDGGNATISEFSRPKLGKEQCNSPSYEAAKKVNRVRVFAPKMEANTWRRAPRRQCCQTRLMTGGSMMEVWIRNCRPKESIIPPPK